MTSTHLLHLLLIYGGKIVRASELNASQRIWADANGNVFTDAEGNSFAWLSKATQASTSSVGFGSLP